MPKLARSVLLLELVIVLLSISLVVGPSAVLAPPEEVTLKEFLEAIPMIRIRISNHEGFEAILGYEVVGQEVVRGQDCYKVAYRIEQGGTVQEITLWISKETGACVQAAIGGQVVPGLGGQFEQTLFDSVIRPVVGYSENSTEYVSPPDPEYGTVIFLGESYESYGPTAILVEKYKFMPGPKYPDPRIEYVECWVGEVEGAVITTYALIKIRPEHGGGWSKYELLSIEIVKPPPLPPPPPPPPQAAAQFAVKELVVSPARVGVGREITVSVTVENTGDAAGTYTVTLKVDGAVVESREVELGPGESTVVTFTIVGEEVGEHTVEVDGLTRKFVVTAAAPPEFEISNLRIFPSEVEVGQSVTVTVTVTNVGGERGIKKVVLRVDGFKLVKEVELNPGESKEVSFSIQAKEEKTYAVEIEGLKGTFVAKAPAPKKCIIATAAYGSELAPEVQMLRNFRDGVVMKTFAGSRFMEVFNAWYYSWSPHVAPLIAESELLKAATRTLLRPLLCVLQLSRATCNALSFNSEVGVVAAGFVASALIGAVYFSPLALAILVAVKKRIRLVHLRYFLALLALATAAIAVSEVAASDLAMMASTALFVCTTVALSASVVASGLLYLTSRVLAS